MENIKFDITMNGYNKEQVDKYIDELKNELLCSNISNESLSKENKALRDELLSVIKTLSKKLEEVDNADFSEKESVAEGEKAEITAEESSSAEETAFENEAKKAFDDFSKELESFKSIFG